MKDNQILPPCESASTFLQSQTNPLHRILVVEDDASILRLNTEMLQRSGYEVDAAEDGAAAWEALNAKSYDLLITDNVMPKVTGVKLLERLRAARMVLPVIMATGAVPTALFTRCPWLQPNATLLKPYTAAEMLRTVKKVLREADGTGAGPQLFVNRAMKDNQSLPTCEPASAPLEHPTNPLPPSHFWRG